MSFLQKTNNAKSLVVDSPLTAGATTLNITASSGSKFPSTGDFMLTIWNDVSYSDPGDDPGMELVRATARTGDSISITRGQEGTTGVQHAAGSRVGLLVTAGTLNEELDQNVKTTDTVTFNSVSETTRTLVKFTDSVNVLADVDTVSTTPSRDQVLKWNGTNWVPAVYSDSFAMLINTFSSGQSTPQSIGSGTWKATGAISFTASYINPPPTSASIALSSTGGVTWSSPLTLTTPFTSGTSAQNTSYPSSKDTTITFTLTAYDGATPRTSATTITFNNYRYWGILNHKSSFTQTEIKGLSSELSFLPNGSKVINSTSGNYLIWAYPSSYTAINTNGFLFNSVTCPFEAVATVSITNAAGFTENYKVYAVTNPSLGNSTLTTSTSASTIDPLYYGVTTKTSTFLESDVKNLANNSVTNTNTQTWNSVNSGVGQYLLFAFPTRLGIPTFYVGGFEGGFQTPETVSVTNINGYTENYYVWRSDNSNLGATVVVTQ